MAASSGQAVAANSGQAGEATGIAAVSSVEELAFEECLPDLSHNICDAAMAASSGQAVAASSGQAGEATAIAAVSCSSVEEFDLDECLLDSVLDLSRNVFSRFPSAAELDASAAVHFPMRPRYGELRTEPSDSGDEWTEQSSQAELVRLAPGPPGVWSPQRPPSLEEF